MIKEFGPGDYVVEPANVQITRCVTSIDIANMPRLETLPPPGINDDRYGESNDFVKNYAIRGKRGIRGSVSLVEGYNCELRVDEDRNEVTVSGVPGGGMSNYAPQPSEIAVTEEEKEADGYLSKGYKCKDIVKMINGLELPNITISGGNGVKVVPSAGELKIVFTQTARSKDCEMPECKNYVTDTSSSTAEQ